MQVSYQWLQELLPELKHSPAEIAELLTMHSYEVEVDREIKIDPAIIVARIEQLEPHPNADRLRLATITTGSETVKVVCGAPNINQGDVVPFAPVGATVADEDGKPWQLKEATIRRERSLGMLNSPRELGLGNWHGGILQLPTDTPIGSAVNQHFPDDTILEVDLTPNRAHDSYCHLGIARELAGLLGLKVASLQHKQLEQVPSADDWTVNIDESLASRYVALVYKDISNYPAPLWMQARLFACGARPINAIVDCTNYVMFEQGNPTHAFDSDKLPAQNLTVAAASAGDAIVTLDGQERKLKAGNPVIKSGGEIVGLAGVMGSASTQIDNGSTSMVLEIANFTAYPVQQVAAHHKLFSEGAQRWSKGVDPQLAIPAASRLAQLLEDTIGATPVGIKEHNHDPHVPRVIEFDPNTLEKVAGVPFDPLKAEQALTHMRFEVVKSEDHWQITVPSNRLDVQASFDITEEIIRVIGYDDVPGEPLSSLDPTLLSGPAKTKEAVRDILVNLGFSETYNYSFEQVTDQTILAGNPEQAVTITNPVSPEQQQLRQRLLPGLIRNAVTNKDEFHHQQLFEIGRVFEQGTGGLVPGIIEQEYAAGLIVSPGSTKQSVQNIVDHLAEQFGVAVNENIFPFVDNLPVDLLNTAKLKQPAAAFVIDIEQLATAAAVIKYQASPKQGEVKYQPISPYPPSFRDISILTPAGTTIHRVQEIIANASGQYVVDVDLFDTYQHGEQRSLAFRIKYQSQDQTLTDKQIEKAHQAILGAIGDVPEFEVRE